MGKRPFVRFYHLDWKGDGDVEKMSMTEVGTYWTLLVRQMVDRSIEVDFNELRRCLNVDTVAEVVALVTPRIRKKFHTSKCVDKTCEGWYCNTPGDDPTRLYNRRLVDVIIETDNARDKGRDNAFRGHNMIRTPSLESAVVAKSEVEETPSFDFTEILRIMPKRRKNGRVEGWDRGKEMLKYITTQEEFDDLLAATQTYAKSRRGEDAGFHYSLENWVTKEYFKHVPPRAEPKAAVVLPGPGFTPPAAPAVPTKRFPLSWCVPESPVRSTTVKPPWIDIPISDLAERQRCARLFPTDAEKRAWWMTTNDPEQHAGA